MCRSNVPIQSQLIRLTFVSSTTRVRAIVVPYRQVALKTIEPLKIHTQARIKLALVVRPNDNNSNHNDTGQRLQKQEQQQQQQEEIIVILTGKLRERSSKTLLPLPLAASLELTSAACLLVTISKRNNLQTKVSHTVSDKIKRSGSEIISALLFAITVCRHIVC